MTAHDLLHALEHALKETLWAIPFLFLAYLLMEFIEHKASQKMEGSLRKIGKAGPAIGSALGVIPQCGFSASASNLYTAGLITEGTLISVFLATSDEAIPILISNSGARGDIWLLLLCKLGIGIISGFIVDFIYKHLKIQKVAIDICEDCGCEKEEGILKPALKHTLKIIIFIFIVNIVIELAMGLLGEQRLSAMLLSGNLAQPFITALFGLIPNCAVSAALTQLYAAGAISFGSCVAGLCSGAGVGLAVLFKANKCKKENIRIILLLYGISSIFGFILMLFGL
ncbi:MAG: arsenic efflux protein [Clostridia bacterium]|nr:arsenic efflux protein [Clostridia bacterium]